MSEEIDERLKYMARQVSHAFRHIAADKLADFWNNEGVERVVLEFLNNPESQVIFFRESKGTLEVLDVPVAPGKNQLFYFVKLNKTQVSEKRIASELIYGDIAANPLEHMASLAQRIYHPMVGTKESGQAWSEVVAKEVRDYFESFVANVQITQGHVKGLTCLPLPNQSTSSSSSTRRSESFDDLSVASAGSAVTVGEKEEFRNIHALEGALITWTKQIKNVLKQDPESLFQTMSNPGPTAEVEFWKSKASNLNNIFDQLQSTKVRRVLKVLDQSKSTYNAPFAKLCKDVFHARAEANNIIKYLRPLVAWFEGLERETDFENLVNHFPPIIHLILLVWKSSAYYNTPSRLVILMREICNTLIRQACTYLNGDVIFELIENEETHTAVKMLKTVLKVFGKFKSIYFEYKARSSVECPENDWKVQNNAVFIRLDSFLERCHDILDFSQTIIMFGKLAKIEVGGTKGKTLTTSIAQIYSDFTQFVDCIRSVGKGILDLENKQFEEAFYEFRTRIKELDRRLGSVIVQGFDDASTVAGRFRLLDSFDNLITRPIVADALEKKHVSLIESIRVDLQAVQNIFNEHRDAPLIASNLPPIAGALTWCRGLRDRIQGPMEKLKTLDKKILEREDTREVIKTYTALMGHLSDLDKENIETWGHSIEASSQAKLKNPLLRREVHDAHLGSSLLYVFFDPILVKLLREVKYFLLLGLEVPSTATEIYQRVEIFRRHTGNLDLIVNMYNDIQTSLLPVERPLVRGQLDRIDKTLSQGIGEGKNKAKALNWKSNGIDIFIGEAMTEVKEVNEMLQMLKGNLKCVEQAVGIWQTAPLFERGYKTVLTQDFMNLQKKTRQSKLQAVKEAGQEIHRLLKDTNKKLKVSQGLPDWKAYVDFQNNVVVYGLVDAMTASLRTMAAQFNPVHLTTNNIPALLEIQIDLVDKNVKFIPEVGFVEIDNNKTSQGLESVGIKNIVSGWINGMLGLASVFKRLDSNEGTFLRELTEAPQVNVQKARVLKFLSNMELSANKLRNVFKKFEYLWKTNLNELFAEFVKEVVQIESVPFENESQNADTTAAPVVAVTPAAGAAPVVETHLCWEKTNINLDKFNEKIRGFLEIQVEVGEIKTIHDIDFLKVNAQPVKQAISTWVTKWLYMFTQYLQNYVGERLNDLYGFIQDVNKGLDVPVENGNREVLMSVMKFIHNVRKRKPELSSLFEPMQNIVALLKANTIAIDLAPIGGQPALDFLEHSKMLWENTVNKAFRVKENIHPLVTSMVEGIKKEVKQFNENVFKFVKNFRSQGPFTWLEGAVLREVYLRLDDWQKELMKLVKESKAINDLEDLFELPLSTHASIREVEQDLRSLKNVWDNVMLIETTFAMWKNTIWLEIKTDELLEEVKKLMNELKRHSKKAKEWNVFKRLETEVKNMVVVLPLVHDLHSPAMRERHWKSLFALTGTSFDRGPSFCLDDLLGLNLQYHVESVSEIVEVANKELKIENKLQMIEDVWRKFTLRFDQHRDTEVFIVSPPDDVLEALEEHSLLLQSMAGMGKFVDFFREQVSYWLLSLGEVETTLKLLLLVERQWGSLESIFLGSADIRAQLPDDTKRFEVVDNEFKEQMRECQAKPGVLVCCRADGREQALINMHKELEKCEKALNEYLEIKKSAFPRFYFVSNAALLDILSNGNCPPKIMQHIGSVFDGIGDLELCYSAGQLKALKDEPETHQGPMEAARSMISKDNEKVAFPAVFEMKGAVETWLSDLVRNMQSTLRGVLFTSMQDALAWDGLNPREDWVFTVPAQIALVTSQIVWTEEVESAMEEIESGQEDALKKYNEVCTARLESLIRLVQMELSKGDRIKIITVITIDVHNRDVVQALIAKKVENNVDFKWQSQLRYYWLPDDRNVNIRICDFQSLYSFEYVGNCGRLVITPLTDRCYVTLTVALRLMLGGAPAGPAGTGKTETTKDLSRGLGLPCYVFNCSDQMNYQTMGDIFKGLTQVGAWGCFDEFNRIEIEVLSVVASQVRCILDAIILFAVPGNRALPYQQLPAGTPPVKVGMFNFFGEQIALIPTVGMFITMNPGYAGRTELPENLKALFRSCAMIQPDFLPISENMLMAEGFVRARPLSVKFVTLYKLSSELLSKQHHYDWGLRAIKSVLRVAGMLKRADPNVEEEAILMRALRDFNTPKIPSNDIPIFLRLISDLFPALDLPPKLNQNLYKVCVEVCKAQGLCPEEMFVSKVLQYQELLDVRHSVMLLGPAGCGKTSVWKTLAACHNYNKPKPVTLCETVNPKSLTTDELYGYMTLSKDWRDGVLSIVMRNMSKNNSPYYPSQTGKWVVLDGDIDAVWIESMNTVMDDNKVLTLVSNERIPLSDAMRMVFEIHTLKNATPATVSRAGILYINDTDVGYTPFIDSWLASRTNDVEKSYLPYLVNRYLSKTIEFVIASKLEMIVPLPTINLVQSFCFMLDGMLKSIVGEKSQPVMERIFLYCLMWAFGGALSADKQIDYRKLFSNYFKTLNKAIKFPDNGTVLDYYIDPSSGDVVTWQSKVASFVSSAPDTTNSSIVVPTAESVRLTFGLNNLVRNGRPVMFVGSAGTGKTILVSDFLGSLSATEDSFKSVTINMNFYTDSAALQLQLEQNIDKRSGKTYGPTNGKLIYFVDDINLPFVETYGTQTPIALMRQHLDNGGWYDRSDLSLKKQIIDCQYVSCMNHKSGSFFIDPRLQRHFVTFACSMPSEQDLFTIFGTILNSHLFNFDKKIQARSKNITDATITLHKEICTKFLPSAVKFHYNFTMRDLSSVFKGLLNSRPSEQTTTVQISRLWFHEVTRVFSDRLITDIEVNRCKDVIVNVGKRFMEDDPELVYADPCIFTHFVSPNTDELSNYKVCDDMVKLKKVLEAKLVEYNEGHAIMNLVLFEQAIRHVARIARILMFPGGHALLVGVGGSGKQSLSKLAAHICRYPTYQISVTSDYSVNDLKEHLKEMYRKSGVKPGEGLVFLLTDSQITDERFLVYINDLLSSGRIPDLFTKEDYDGIFASLRSIAKAEGIPDNRDSMMDFFISRVKANFHMVLCFSPVGDTFRQRARKFPGIINCTSIDWFHEWPKEALVSVAQRFLENVETGGSPEVRDNIAYHIAEVHTSVGESSLDYLKKEKRFNYVTPKSFLELIEFYKHLLNARRGEMFASIKRLETGLETLMRTNKDVEVLQEFLKEKKKEVEFKKAATDKLLEEMGKQRSEAEGQQAMADIEKKKADTAAEEAAKLEQQAAGDLAIAKPALDAAVEAVKCLDKASLTELKSFSKPPAGVDKVTTALLIMIKLEKKDFSWENAKKMMAKVDAFKERLESYRGEDIPEDVIAKVLPMLDDPEFTYEKMKSKSAAAANLANWVINIINFNGIYKRVKPLMESLDVATKSKRKAEEDLAVVKEKLAVVEAKLQKLQTEFMAATGEKAKVEQEARECMERLSLAERLTFGLASEKDRWFVTVDKLKEQETTLAGDVMLAAAFTSYIGAFGAQFRNTLWREVWLVDLIARSIPLTANIDPLWVLTNDSQTAEWANEGLPSDRISLENGAIISNCNRWPLLIDPQLQGIRWLKKHEELRTAKNNRKLIVMRQGEKMWMNKIVNAIQQGDTVILENIGESLDASLDSVLTKAVFRKGKTLFLKVGEEDVEYDEHFRLYLQTKLSNPHYKPEISAQCTIINFIVTRRGLEDQLLATIVSEEEPELEKTRNNLVQAFNNYKIQLKELEDLLLERLANAPVDILSDIPLIEGLEATKQTATEINDAVAKGILTEIGINQAREVYRLIATEASLFYFVLLQLCNVNHMYQYSLDSFTMFFLKALKSAPVASNTAERVVNLQSTLRWTIFKWVNRGLFEKHRLIFLTQMTLSLMQQGIIGEESGFTPEGLRFLLVGPKLGEDKSTISWVNDVMWNGIKTLSALDGFEKLPADMEENSPRFLEWYQNFTPEAEKLPGAWRELDKNPFKKLLVVRVLRPDRITVALTNFIRDTLPKGKEYVECDSEFNSYQILEQSFEDSSPIIPVYFIVSPGADVVADVDKLALKQHKAKGLDYHSISLGQGQDRIAEEKLEIGTRQGHWVFLNNVHLMPRFLTVVEKKIEEYAIQGTHPNFRIMFSSDPSTGIPVSILDRCIKITSDPPSGLKANLKQAFACFSRETYEELESRTKGILFGLCQFHAVMVERKKFGAKGYNMSYPFSVGDLICSAAVLRNYMESAPAKVPWADLRYLFGEIMYGGHIVNDFDRLLANTYLEFYMKEELLEEMPLYPHLDATTSATVTEIFKAPTTSASYDLVIDHIDEDLKTETPLAFGLHPNAEIGFRTNASEELLRMILELSSGSTDGAIEGQDNQQMAEAVIQDVLESLRDVKYDNDAMSSGLDDIGPFQNVILQECERMNGLVGEIVRSLIELDLGFKGDLTVSDAMEDLANALYMDRVPRRWEQLAYPSMRSLGAWLADLQNRISQLNDWFASPEQTPVVTWICGLYNPPSFLTAVMQITAQSQGLELDKLSLLTDVTKRLSSEEFTVPAKDGTFINGLFLEGGSWNIHHSVLEPSKPREMFCPLPVINIRPALADKQDPGTFLCPVYKTQQRGPTYVFSLQLKTKYDPGKWVLAGVVSIMDIL